MCRSNCLMSRHQKCQPITCHPYNHNGTNTINQSRPVGFNESMLRDPLTGIQLAFFDNATKSARAYYGGKIAVSCARNYVTFDGLARCTKTFYPTCQADKMFDHRDICVRATCAPYVAEDSNVHSDLLTTRRISSGNEIQFQCRKEYQQGHGYTFNSSLSAHQEQTVNAQAFVVRGQEPVRNVRCGATQECEWDKTHKCQRFPCKCMRYDDYLKTMQPRSMAESHLC